APLDISGRRLYRHQTRPIERQIRMLRFDRLPDFFREGLASDFDLGWCPEPEKQARPRLFGAIRRRLEQVVRLVAAFVARDLQIRHGRATFVFVPVRVSLPWPSTSEPCASVAPCVPASSAFARALQVSERPRPAAAARRPVLPRRLRGSCARE